VKFISGVNESILGRERKQRHGTAPPRQLVVQAVQHFECKTVKHVRRCRAGVGWLAMTAHGLATPCFRWRGLRRHRRQRLDKLQPVTPTPAEDPPVM
jgi:hypothetical protein